DRGEEFSQREFQKILPLLIREERIVIDEFHRLDEPVFSTLQALSGRGRMILNNINNALLQKSCQEPLFGLFELREVGLVDPRDAILFARELGLKGRKLLEVACIAREP
ncbi:MAG: ATP-binding protein, partial [Candidatus Baldrarchaeia archaeon]